MTEKLLEQRGELELAYIDANEACQAANTVCLKASAAVEAFDAEHPEVMLAVKEVLNEKRRVESPAAIAVAAAADEGDQT